MKSLRLFLCILCTMLTFQAHALEEAPPVNISADRANAISIELFGRGGLYSLNYDRMISDSFALGVGISFWGFTDYFGDTASVLIIPIYANYYFSTDPNRFYVTAGIDYASFSTSGTNSLGNGFNSFNSSGVAGIIGLGYEHRGTGGFLFRIGPYVLFGAGGATAWGGMAFGYAF